MLRLVAATEVGVLGPVDAAVAPGVTAEDAPTGEGGPLEETVDPECVQRVLGARRMESAAGRKQRRENGLVPADQAGEQAARNGSEAGHRSPRPQREPPPVEQLPA